MLRQHHKDAEHLRPYPHPHHHYQDKDMEQEEEDNESKREDEKEEKERRFSALCEAGGTSGKLLLSHVLQSLFK